MQIKTYDSDESRSLTQEEKFSSFTEMLHLGWNKNHYRSDNSLIRVDLDDVIDVEIDNDSLSEAKMPDKSFH